MDIKDCIDYKDIMSTYDPEKNTTKNIMSKYERTKILGVRAEQLQRGAVPNIEFDESNFNPLEIARQELEQRKIPFIVVRKLPNGTKEYWRLDDMIILPH
jgi:DNA-directed RNA polymerase I, II, and III subunit RPABC2